MVTNKTTPLALQHKDYLTLLSKSKQSGRRKKLIDIAEKNEINAVAECVENILNGNVPLTKSQLRKLSRHKNNMRKLRSTGKQSTLAKKRILKQSGGLLPMLLPLAVNAITGLIGNLVK